MSKDQITSQCLGISLAITTAVGCLAYERLVFALPYFFVGMLISLHYLPFWAISGLTTSHQNPVPIIRSHWIAASLMMVSGATGPIWYSITKKQGLMVGSIYEIKYVIVLGLFYSFTGAKPFTANTIIGVALAIGSIYFISK